MSVRAPQANAFCERVIGTIRRACLDFMIAMSERHVRAILREGQSLQLRPATREFGTGHPVGELIRGSPDIRLAAGHRFTAVPLLGGLHHEYRLDREAA